MTLVNLVYLAALITVAITAVDYTNCKVGDQWVDNFIAYECYANPPAVFRGIKSIGCSTVREANNTKEGFVSFGTTYSGINFDAECNKDENQQAHFIAIYCKASDGTPVLIKQEYTDAKGFKWHCQKSGDISMLIQERDTRTCDLPDGTPLTYQMAAEVAVKNGGMLKAVTYSCGYWRDNQYKLWVDSCVPVTGKNIPVGSVGVINKKFYSCVKDKKDNVTLTLIEPKCELNGQSYSFRQNWTNAANTLIYECAFVGGQIKVVVKGCFDKNGNIRTLYNLILPGRKMFMCRNSDSGDPLDFEYIEYTYSTLPSCGIHGGVERKISDVNGNGEKWIEDGYEWECKLMPKIDIFKGRGLRIGCVLPKSVSNSGNSVIYNNEKVPYNTTHSMWCIRQNTAHVHLIYTPVTNKVLNHTTITDAHQDMDETCATIKNDACKHLTKFCSNSNKCNLEGADLSFIARLCPECDTHWMVGVPAPKNIH